MHSMLDKRHIVVGISGGIAVYKVAELVRSLCRLGADVHVVMTKNAMEFVTPLTFQTLSGNPVTHEMFGLFTDSKIGHIALSDMADQVVIAPATANIIGKIAERHSGRFSHDDGHGDHGARPARPFDEYEDVGEPHRPVERKEAAGERVPVHRARFRGPGVRVAGQGKAARDRGDRGEDGRHPDCEGLCRREGARHGRAHLGAYRPRALHHEPVFREDGLRRRQDRKKKGGRGGPYIRGGRLAAAEKRHQGRIRRDRRGDEGGRDEGAAEGVRHRQGCGSGRLQVQGPEQPEDQEEDRPGRDHPVARRRTPTYWRSSGGRKTTAGCSSALRRRRTAWSSTPWKN